MECSTCKETFCTSNIRYRSIFPKNSARKALNFSLRHPRASPAAAEIKQTKGLDGARARRGGESKDVGIKKKYTGLP